MFSNQPSIPHTQLQLFAAPTVVIVSGWGGAGKTQTIARALEGLAQNIDQVGVIIN
jgi:septum formation inhibitor-activating ATPase MinD